MLLDRYLERWDVRSRHQTVVAASAGETYRAVRRLDMGRSLPATALFAVRAVPLLLTGKAQLRRSITLDTVIEGGFVILGEDSGRELVMGVVGKFWRPDGGIEPIEAPDFEGFDSPGFAKGAFNFTVEEQSQDSTLLTTETRVLCTDDSARRKFRLYWGVIGPFSGAIRHMMLRELRRDAEAASLVEPAL
jgi:hypothetical protein